MGELPGEPFRLPGLLNWPPLLDREPFGPSQPLSFSAGSLALPSTHRQCSSGLTDAGKNILDVTV